MPPRKIKVVDVLNSNEPPEGQPVAAITDEPPEAENQPPEITTEPLEVVEPEVVEPEVVEPEQPAQNVSTTKTVELVECPDCGKKMTMKTLKYSHAKNCTKNKKQQVEKEEEKENELERTRLVRRESAYASHTRTTNKTTTTTKKKKKKKGSLPQLSRQFRDKKAAQNTRKTDNYVLCTYI